MNDDLELARDALEMMVDLVKKCKDENLRLLKENCELREKLVQLHCEMRVNIKRVDNEEP